jgi:hypothetical protein
MYLNGIAAGSTLSMKCEVIIPMTTFNLFTQIRFFPDFFGNWIFEIVPTLDNMVIKVINYNGIAMNALNTHANKELAYEFYKVGIKACFN